MVVSPPTVETLNGAFIGASRVASMERSFRPSRKPQITAAPTPVTTSAATTRRNQFAFRESLMALAPIAGGNPREWGNLPPARRAGAAVHLPMRQWPDAVGRPLRNGKARRSQARFLP